MPIVSGKDKRLTPVSGGSFGGFSSILSGDQAMARQREAQRFQSRHEPKSKIVRYGEPEEKRLAREEQERRAAIDIEESDLSYRMGRRQELQGDMPDEVLERQKEMYRMKTDTEKQRMKERRSTFESGVKQIEDAYEAGKINEQQRNKAMKDWSDKHSDVSGPWFAEAEKEDNQPMVDIGGGEKVPALLDSQGRPDPGKTTLEWNKQQEAKQALQEKKESAAWKMAIEATKDADTGLPNIDEAQKIVDRIMGAQGQPSAGEPPKKGFLETTADFLLGQGATESIKQDLASASQQQPAPEVSATPVEPEQPPMGEGVPGGPPEQPSKYSVAIEDMIKNLESTGREINPDYVNKIREAVARFDAIPSGPENDVKRMKARRTIQGYIDNLEELSRGGKRNEKPLNLGI